MTYSKEKMRDYINDYRKKKRFSVISSLGGKCVNCGSLEKLEIDHIKREDKVKPVSWMYTDKLENLLNEVKKCQLLCTQCHKLKTRKEIFENLEHGTLSLHQRHGCRCDICVGAFREYHRNYKKTRRKWRGMEAVKPG